LALAAWLPGVAHAPGFPLWTLLGWLWSHLIPAGRMIWRLNLLSAFWGAAAVGLTYALALHSLRSPGRQRDDAPLHRLVPAAIAAIAVGMGRTFWGWSTAAEVYTLSAALVAAILVLIMRWAGLPEDRMSHSAPARPTTKRRVQRAKPARTGSSPAVSPGVLTPAAGARLHAANFPLVLAALLFGLGLGAHLTSVALLAPAIAFWITVRRGWRFWISKTALAAGLALGAGAAIYLYLPLVAGTDPLLNWGQPDTWQRFWWHVTARQYRVSLLSSPVGPQVAIAGSLWWTQFTPIGLGLALAGAWHMLRRQRGLWGMLAIVIACVTLYAWAYVIEDDGDAYYLPAFVAGAVWVAWGARAVLVWLDTKLGLFREDGGDGGRAGRGRWLPGAGLLVLATSAALALNGRACDRRADTISEDYVRDAWAEIAPNGLLLTRDWQFYAPSLYLQHVERVRPDVTVIDTELLRRGWYLDYLRRLDPGLMAAVAHEAGVFGALRDAWELGALPDGDPRIGQLQAAYVALLDAFIREANAAGRPVHIGPNRGAEPLRGATLRGIPDMEAGVGSGLQWWPVGLTFWAAPSGAEPSVMPPLDWQLEAFSRAAPTAPELKIRASRADMAVLRALYHASIGASAMAQADVRIALRTDPTHTAAQELAGRLGVAE
jgi:hypothetical protein